LTLGSSPTPDSTGHHAQDVHAPAPAGLRPRGLRHSPILIVEDDADLRDMMAQLLALEGFRAETVSNGREALEYLRRGDFPEVILLDLMMPVMDGWEFLRHQQQNAEFAAVPVVVLSAVDTNSVGRLEDTAFLKKPLDFDRLLDMVRRYCGEADC
jgi:CheY-like chemotaxis protein